MKCSRTGTVHRCRWRVEGNRNGRFGLVFGRGDCWLGSIRSFARRG